MNQNQPPIQCPQCNGRIILKQGKKQDGSFYKFYGCENFMTLGCRYTWRPAPIQKVAPAQPDLIKGLGIIRGDIKRLEEKIEEIAQIIRRFKSEEKIVVYPSEEELPYAKEDMPDLDKKTEPRELEEEL
uniref:Putative topoisomerase DNA binding C4 zinc finger protein n=1 Tax=viral metagenome TaxID=1070528 RepID=A0A6M3XZA9_9ZZZZ